MRYVIELRVRLLTQETNADPVYNAVKGILQFLREHHHEVLCESTMVILEHPEEE